MSIFVGLDCGGSSSRVLAIDEDGQILYQGQSGAANLASTPEGRLRRNLQSATRDCPTPDYVCGCFAGLINETMRSKGLAILGELFPRAQLRAEPDYTAAYYASDGADICVIAGTGSLICSKVNGRIVKSGGRGYILGDEGAAVHFGRDAVHAFLNFPDQASPSLRKHISDVFGSLYEPEIVLGVYKAPTPATILGKMAKATGIDAHDGVPYAVASVQRHLGNLATLVARHVRQFHPKETRLTISLAGGIWKAGQVFGRTFHDLIRQEIPGVELIIHRLSKPPLHGAVQLAKEIEHGH